MTKNERLFLKNAIKYVINFDRDNWMTLKREIWDRGYQFEYFTLGDFIEPIDIALKMLSEDEREGLLKEYRKTHNDSTKDDDKIIFTYYFAVILEEVRRRAWNATWRTTNWD